MAEKDKPNFFIQPFKCLDEHFVRWANTNWEKTQHFETHLLQPDEKQSVYHNITVIKFK